MTPKFTRNSRVSPAANTLFPYNGFLGCNTTSGRPYLDYDGVANWVADYGPVESSLLLDSIRYGDGTPGNWWNWSTQRLDHARCLVFDDTDTTASAVYQASVNTSGLPDICRFSDFSAWVDSLSPQPKRIFAIINVYTQTLSEIYAGIDAFKSALGNRVIHWELGNELSAGSVTSGAAISGYAYYALNGFAGAYSATAKTYFPSGRFDANGADLAVKCNAVLSYIKGKYSSDKVGIPSKSERGHRRPDNSAGSDSVTYIDTWASTINALLPELDGVIEHLYVTPSDYWTLLNNTNTALYTDAKWLTGIGEPAENTYRWMMAYAQHAPRITVAEHRKRWRDKELWLTELGSLMLHTTVTDVPAEIDACEPQCVFRYLWLLNHYIAWAAQVIETNGAVKSAMNHAAIHRDATSPAASHFHNGSAPTNYLSANGIVYYLLRYLSSGMTQFSVPFISVAAALTRKGVLSNYSSKVINPVSALFFTDGTTQKLLVLNITNSARTVTIPFPTYSIHGIDPAQKSLSLFSTIPSTGYLTSADFTTTTGSTSTYAIPAYSCYVFTNTSPAVHVGNTRTITVT